MPTQDQSQKNSSVVASPKAWTDLTVDEKIERMREIVKSLSRTVVDSNQTIHRLRAKLKTHEHKDGKVYEMKEIKDYDDDAHRFGQLTGDPRLNDYF